MPSWRRRPSNATANACDGDMASSAATHSKVTGEFRSAWGDGPCAAVRSVIGTAARRGVDAYQAIQQTLRGQAASYPD